MTPSAHFDFGGYRRPTDIRMARTQREAGIEFRGWEARLNRRRSWLEIVAIGLGLAFASIAALALLSRAHDATSGWW